MSDCFDHCEGHPDDDELPVLVTTSEAAVLAKVEPATIRRWKARKKLRPVGRTPDGKNLFELPAVFRVQRGDDPRDHWGT